MRVIKIAVLYLLPAIFGRFHRKLDRLTSRKKNLVQILNLFWPLWPRKKPEIIEPGMPMKFFGNIHPDRPGLKF